MKKTLLLLLLTTVALFFVNAQNNPQRVTLAGDPETSTTSFVPSHEGPYIEFEKTAHDYGQIVLGDNGESEFTFKNLGSEPLVLLNVQTSCGCAAPSWPREPVMPGQEAMIKVQYNTHTPGNIGRTVTVFSNSLGGRERIVLRLTGHVHPR